jgi:hypothetical protein
MPSMHGRFSRYIEPLSQPKPGFFGWLLLTAIAGAILFGLVVRPVGTLSAFAGLAVVTFVAERKHARRVVSIAGSRENEDIGSFARAFERRANESLDPWAIRAAWNALVPLTEASGRQIPLRPTDRFAEDLLLDPDDLEDLVPQLVEQCERVPGNWKANPFYHRLNTVADLVYFISAQPLRRLA